jgi:hypothetical protein
MRAIIVVLTALCVSLFSAGASFAKVTTYIVNVFFPVESIKIDGIITTDGKMGVLSQADIVDFDMIAGGAMIGISINPEETFISLTGDDLVAAGRDLTFDYGANDGGILSFQWKFLPLGYLFWCNASGGQDACSQGISLFGFPPNDDFSLPPIESSVALAGTVVLGSVPEPATWTLMLTGFTWLGLCGLARAAKERRSC